jgi:type I restriction enzyme R subunit
MKSNFEFLHCYWPALAEIGGAAEKYLYSDPNTSIFKMGLFAERLVLEIFAFERIDEPQIDNTHANRIRILKRLGLLPRDIDDTLYLLRKTRNSAVHAGADSEEEAKILLSMMYNLAVWFMKTYGDWNYVAPSFVMPDNISSPNFEELFAEQEKKIAELSKQLEAVTTAASGTTQKERVKQSEKVSAMIDWNDAQIRCLIDEQLQKAGWEVDSKKECVIAKFINKIKANFNNFIMRFDFAIYEGIK